MRVPLDVRKSLFCPILPFRDHKPCHELFKVTYPEMAELGQELWLPGSKARVLSLHHFGRPASASCGYEITSSWEVTESECIWQRSRLFRNKQCMKGPHYLTEGLVGAPAPSPHCFAQGQAQELQRQQVCSAAWCSQRGGCLASFQARPHA